MAKYRYIAKKKFGEHLQTLVAYLLKRYLDVDDFTPRRFQDECYSHHVLDRIGRFRPVDSFSMAWKDMIEKQLTPSNAGKPKGIIHYELLFMLIHACAQTTLTPQEIRRRYTQDQASPERDLLGYREAVAAAYSPTETSPDGLSYRSETIFQYQGAVHMCLREQRDPSQLKARAKVLSAIAWDYARAMDAVAIMNHPDRKQRTGADGGFI